MNLIVLKKLLNLITLGKKLSDKISRMITINGIYISFFFRTQQQKIEAKKPPAKGAAKSAAADPASREAPKGKATPAVPKKATPAVKAAPKAKEVLKGKDAPAIMDAPPVIPKAVPAKATPAVGKAPKAIKEAAPPKTDARPKTRARQ